MSAHGDSHGHPPFEQEPERFDGVRVTIVGLVTLAIFALAVVWSTRIWQSSRDKVQPEHRSKPASMMGQAEIGIVDQVPFDMADQAAYYRAVKSRRLNSYGWIEKGKRAHIPIDKAFELVLRDQKGRTP